MYRAAFVFLVGCGSTHSAPSEPPPVNPANTRPAAVAVAFRVLHLHDAENNILEMMQLTIDGARASFTYGSKEGGFPADGGPVCTPTANGGQHCMPATTMMGWFREGHDTTIGTARRQDNVVALSFQRPLHFEMGCSEQWLDVAPANAVLIRPTCTWSVATERIKVLGCVSNGETTPFAPLPGIEQVDPDHETAGCETPKYRRALADGSVAQAVAP